jgi:hypothetical protein
MAARSVVEHSAAFLGGNYLHTNTRLHEAEKANSPLTLRNTAAPSILRGNLLRLQLFWNIQFEATLISALAQLDMTL